MSDKRNASGDTAKPRRRLVADPILDHDSLVTALLHNLATKLTSSASIIYRRHFGLGTTEWRIVALLAKEPWTTPQRISQVIGMDKAAVSRAMRSLEKRGFIIIRPHPSRIRSFELALTNPGIALHNRVICVTLERERRLVSGLSAAEIAMLVDMLRRLHRAVPLTNAPVDVGRE